MCTAIREWFLRPSFVVVSPGSVKSLYVVHAVHLPCRPVLHAMSDTHVVCCSPFSFHREGLRLEESMQPLLAEEMLELH